jgi:hypothetical protein
MCQYESGARIPGDGTHNAAKSSWSGAENNFMITGSHNVRSTPPALTDKVKLCWPECGSTASTLVDVINVKIPTDDTAIETYAMMICRWTEEAFR